MIPKIIHFCWLSDDEYPALIKRCIASWKSKLPDYEIMIWDKTRFDIDSTQWTKEAYEVKKYAFASDYIRFHAVYTYGGIYLDSDVEVLKSFDSLLHLPYFIGTQFDGLIEAAVFGAEKNSSWLLDCMAYYEGRPFIKENGEFDQLVLPVVMEQQISLKRTFKQIPINTDNIEELFLENTTFYTFNYNVFSPKNHQTGKIASINQAFTIHHYNSSWLPTLSRIRLKLVRLLGVEKTEIVLKTFGLRKIRSKAKSMLR